MQPQALASTLVHDTTSSLVCHGLSYPCICSDLKGCLNCCFVSGSMPCTCIARSTCSTNKPCKQDVPRISASPNPVGKQWHLHLTELGLCISLCVSCTSCVLPNIGRNQRASTGAHTRGTIWPPNSGTSVHLPLALQAHTLAKTQLQSAHIYTLVLKVMSKLQAYAYILGLHSSVTRAIPTFVVYLATLMHVYTLARHQVCSGQPCFLCNGNPNYAEGCYP